MNPTCSRCSHPGRWRIHAGKEIITGFLVGVSMPRTVHACGVHLHRALDQLSREGCNVLHLDDMRGGK
jgi:hypothetical protein